VRQTLPRYLEIAIRTGTAAAPTTALPSGISTAIRR